MPKIKHTKNELKTQRDALSRYQRFLPTLELKKQQIQIEVRKIAAAIEAQQTEEESIWNDLAAWVRLFAEDLDWSSYIRLKEIRQGESNIAGVSIPVFKAAVIERTPVDLYQTPPWLDDGLNVLERLIRLRVELMIMEEQQRRLDDELRTTTQRVNLFEKVKLPETKENIRVIRIFLGDEQTAGVVRAKIAKCKIEAAMMSA